MGGSGRIIPKYNLLPNTPFDINKPKEDFSDKPYQGNKYPQQGNKYPQQGNNNSYKSGQNDKPVSTFAYPLDQVPIPNGLVNPSIMQLNESAPMPQYNVPIAKTYNINVQGMNGNLVNASQIFEDILPDSKIAQNRMVSLNERQILHTYIRSILVKQGDGEAVALNDKKPELLNLLSYLKMLEINPYHYSRITTNHYKTLADGFIMFKSCYPIRMDKKIHNIGCAKDSIGTNVRVYALTMFDELSYVLNEEIGTLDGGKARIPKQASDTWREIMFYTFVREEILKKKLCPHFPYLHAYFIADNNSIDFEKLKGMKKEINSLNRDGKIANEVFRNAVFKDNMHSAITSQDGFNFTVEIEKINADKNTEVFKFNRKTIGKSRLVNGKTIEYENNQLDVNQPSNRCAVAITEAPDINIIDWSTRTYVIEDGPIRKQIATGMRSDLTWKSLLFQMFITFLVMFSKKIVIQEFSWEKNVYIKNLNDVGSIGFWKYNVKNISFYVPNMKALLMIDTNFDQITNGYTNDLNEAKFKLKGEFFEELVNTDDVTYASNCPKTEDYKELFENMFDTQVFGGQFTKHGGIKPSQDIITMMDEIKGKSNLINADGPNEPNESSIPKLVKCLITFFGSFLHNKIGEQVLEADMDQLFGSGDNIQQCECGDLIAINISESTELFVWAIYISQRQGSYIILKKSGISYDTSAMDGNKIKRSYGRVSQQYKPDSKIDSDDDLIETYDIRV